MSIIHATYQTLVISISRWTVLLSGGRYIAIVVTMRQLRGGELNGY